MPKNKGWFRFYDRAIDNPKIKSLSSEAFRLLTSLWCLASSSGGGNGETGHTKGQVKQRFSWLHSPGNKFEKWWQELRKVDLVSEKAMENGNKSNEEAHEKRTQSNGEVKKIVIIPNWNEHQYDYQSKIPSYRKEKNWDNSSKQQNKANVKLTGNQREENGKIDTDTETETDTEKRTTYAVSCEKSTAQPPTPKIEFTDGFKNIMGADKEKWSKAYPALDIEQELMRMETWVIANPKNRKSNWRKFIVNWLARSQDKAPGTKKITWKDIEAREKELARKKREDNKPIPSLAPIVKEISAGLTIMQYEKKAEDCTNPKKAKCQSPYCPLSCSFRGDKKGAPEKEAGIP